MAHVPLRLRLNADALVANWRWLREQGGAAACGAAVKADGYGLGAREVVRRLAAAGCRDFFVATWAEAEALMPWPEELALSVLHGVGPDDLDAARSLPARPVLNSAEQVARWQGQGPCDIMVDTGINRLGLTPQQARSGMLDGLRVRTLMSHLACADEPDHPMNERQLKLFRALRSAVPANRYSLANSAGICLGPKYGFGLSRPGLALYGGVPVPNDDAQRSRLRPVVSIEAQVVQVRNVPAGAGIGYNHRYLAPHDTRLAVLNIGYADGYLRALAEAAYLTVGDQRFPVVGVISMDLLAIDATPRTELHRSTLRDGRWEKERIALRPAEVAEGDWLELPFDLPALAERSGLSQYELLTGLGSRFERFWT